MEMKENHPRGKQLTSFPVEGMNVKQVETEKNALEVRCSSSSSRQSGPTSSGDTIIKEPSKPPVRRKLQLLDSPLSATADNEAPIWKRQGRVQLEKLDKLFGMDQAYRTEEYREKSITRNLLKYVKFLPGSCNDWTQKAAQLIFEDGTTRFNLGLVIPRNAKFLYDG